MSNAAFDCTRKDPGRKFRLRGKCISLRKLGKHGWPGGVCLGAFQASKSTAGEVYELLEGEREREMSYAVSMT